MFKQLNIKDDPEKIEKFMKSNRDYIRHLMSKKINIFLNI